MQCVFQTQGRKFQLRPLQIKFPSLDRAPEWRVLKQYYAGFGTCPYIRQEGNNIPVPLDLEEVFIPDAAYNAPYTPKELDFLVFFGFSSVSAIEYGIRLSDLALEDPPVYLCNWGEDCWRLENTSLQNFLVMSVLWQIAYEVRLEHYLILSQFDYDELPQLNHYITSLGMNDYELENLSVIACYYRICLKDGVILACETDEWIPAEEPPSEDIMWLTAASHDRGKMQEIRKKPDLLWEPDEA